jgi:tetratricopeptide (TPR) repeat protein
MKLSALPSSLVALVIGLAAAPFAHAEQTPPSATSAVERSEHDTERAKALFEQGAQAFAQRRNVEAVYFFRQAAALVPSAEFSYNIGLAYEDMGDIGHALAAYREFVRGQPHSDKRSEVEQRMLALERRLAGVGLQQLSVRSEPPGGTVLIDEKPVGITPWSGELSPGAHRVQVRALGYRSAEAEVQLQVERASDLNLLLEPVYFNGQGYAPDPVTGESTSETFRTTLGWALLGTGAATLIGGIAFEFSRSSAQSSADEADNAADAAGFQGSADGKQMASLLLLGIGGGLSVSGGLVLALGSHFSTPDDERATPASAPAPAPAPAARPTSPKLLPPSPRPRAASLGVACNPLFCGARASGEF